MPELPEVESARRLVEKHCLGKKIKTAVVEDDDKVFCTHTSEELKAMLEGSVISSTHRKGKQQWWKLGGGGSSDSGDYLGFQFGMTGCFLVKGVESTKYVNIKDNKQWPPRFVKLRLVFDGGTELAFCDSRRFARVRVYDKDPMECPPISLLGFDALTQMPESEPFRESVLRQNVAIKAALLEQKFAAGVGNYIADECLYQAKLHPAARCCDLSDKQIESVRKALAYVVKLACDADADYTRFPSTWLFHYRWTGKQATKDAHGNRVEFIEVGSRTTAFAPALQKKTDSAASAAKQKAASTSKKATSTSKKASGGTKKNTPSKRERGATKLVTPEDKKASTRVSPRLASRRRLR